MNIRPWKRAVALLAVATYLATGCTTLQNVPLARTGDAIARPDVKAGETVVVTTRNGEKSKFTVTGVEDDALVGRDTRIAYADIAQLDVRRGEGVNKGLLIGAVVVGVVAVAAAAGGGGGSSGGY